MSNEAIYKKAKNLSSPFNYASGEAAIILAAGHGKRIKSHRSKMLHTIWGVTTVERVFNACTKAIPKLNSVVVVGIKAEDVMDVFGKKERTAFAFQEEQKGTGHAVQVGLKELGKKGFKGTIYVLPGDMGLIDAETIATFKANFKKSKSDMMVLTGIFEGPAEQNVYGRIIRVKEFDINGKPSGKDQNNVIEIIEHKDILALGENETHVLMYKNREYSYTKKELLEIPEYNSGVYAFDYKKLNELVYKLSANNAQKEVYITDLIGAFNKKGYTVSASSPEKEYVVMGFNDKAVLKEMEGIYRKNIYDKLKNLIEIDDPDDFYIDDAIVERIIALDKKGEPSDIKIGKGAYIGKGVKLNFNIELKKNVFLDGNVQLGKNVVIWENAHISCFPDQQLIIGDNVEILWGDIIKGDIIIGDNSRIESSVNMTGSNEFPLRIGKNVLIKGTSYVFGCIIEDDIYIEHSVLIKKKINKLVKRNGEVQHIRFYLPMPSGIDAVERLDTK